MDECFCCSFSDKTPTTCGWILGYCIEKLYRNRFQEWENGSENSVVRKVRNVSGFCAKDTISFASGGKVKLTNEHIRWWTYWLWSIIGLLREKRTIFKNLFEQRFVFNAKNRKGISNSRARVARKISQKLWHVERKEENILNGNLNPCKNGSHSLPSSEDH